MELAKAKTFKYIWRPKFYFVRGDVDLIELGNPKINFKVNYPIIREADPQTHRHHALEAFVRDGFGTIVPAEDTDYKRALEDLQKLAKASLTKKQLESRLYYYLKVLPPEKYISFPWPFHPYVEYVHNEKGVTYFVLKDGSQYQVIGEWEYADPENGYILINQNGIQEIAASPFAHILPSFDDLPEIFKKTKEADSEIQDIEFSPSEAIEAELVSWQVMDSIMYEEGDFLLNQWLEDEEVILVYSHRRYDFIGRKIDEELINRNNDWDELLEDFLNEYPEFKEYDYYNVYMLDHSGLYFSFNSFNDPWDSGQIGWLFFKDEKKADLWLKIMNNDIDESGLVRIYTNIKIWPNIVIE